VTASEQPPAPAPPSAGALTSLDADAWAAVLVAVRSVHAEVAAPPTAGPVAELLAGPSSRFVSGARRRALARHLAGDAALWGQVVDAARASGLPPGLDRLLSTPAGPVAGAADADDEANATEERVARLRGKLRAVREERDALRRRAEGAEARAARADADAEQLRAALTARDTELAAVRAELTAAAEERARAVARAERRADAEVARLREELAALRREEEDRRQLTKRRAAEEQAAHRAATRQREAARAAAKDAGSVRLVPGRPSQLPRGVRPETTEAARLLLHRGRLVLVDGYNVTLQHQAGLELELQRAWLLRVAAALAASRGVEPVVVFDGARSGGARVGGGRPAAGGRGVEVRFTGPGTTADDEIVLAVEGTDRPVVVVTDDRELRARVTVGGADVIGTRAFLGVAS
jgi:predicted RNA-binding protein with PIN domain